MNKASLVAGVLCILVILSGCGESSLPASTPDIARYTADQVIAVCKANPPWANLSGLNERSNERLMNTARWQVEYQGGGKWQVQVEGFYYRWHKWHGLFRESTGKLIW